MAITCVPQRNLVLIGGRGSGKSALCRRILRLNKNFTLFPLDELIRYEAGGSSIPEIVEQRGWEGFRALELQVVEKVSRFPAGALIDCGGGVVVELDTGGKEVFSARKVAALRHHGHVIYLQRSVKYLQGRSAGDPDRPDLSAELSFREIMERRDPWYRQAAHEVLPCGRRSKDRLAREILERFFAIEAGQRKV
ncbi:MAG TPA: shikimate kinase [Deferrisomatales bacterium]|nr:shikimate kinase [Deferrisomatales bacterium]